MRRRGLNSWGGVEAGGGWGGLSDSPDGRGCSRSTGALSAGPLSPARSAPVSYPATGGESARSQERPGSMRSSNTHARMLRRLHRRLQPPPHALTLMSSGRWASSLFSCSFFRMLSRVFSAGGLGTFSCAGFFSSCEPKLFGSVLLRWRVRGCRSSSDFISLCSVEQQQQQPCSRCIQIYRERYERGDGGRAHLLGLSAAWRAHSPI